MGYYEDSSGIVKNIVPNGGNSGHEYGMVRGAARWLPTERTTVDFMVMYTDESQGIDEAVPSGVWDLDTVATFFLNNPNDPNAITSALDDGTGFWPKNQDKMAHTAIGEKTDVEATVSVLNIQHALTDDIVLKWITGILDTKREKIFDNDLVPEDVVNRYEAAEGTSWSSEMRLEISKENYEWVIGAMYSHDDLKSVPLKGAPGGGLGVVTGITTAVDTGVFLGPVPGGDPTVPIVGPGLVDFALVGPEGALPPLFDLGGGFFLTNLTPDGQGPLCLGCGQRKHELKSIAVFSDFTFHVNEQLDLTVGARYTADDVFSKFTGIGLFRRPRLSDPADPTGLTPLSITATNTFHDLSPRFSVGYQVTDDARLYATVSKGYKAGGFTQNWENDEYSNERFKNETLWNYEAGFKTEWLDHRLRLNGSVFLLQWDDLQIETIYFAIPGDATSNVNKTINVGEAEAKGFELELAAAPTDQLTITGGVGILDTEIKSNDFARLAGFQEVSLKGEELPRSPKLTFNLAAEYHWPVGSHDMFLRGEYIYKDTQYSTIEDVTYRQTSNAFVAIDKTLPAVGDNIAAQVPDRSDGFPFKTPDANLFNLRGGFSFNDSWLFTVFVENLTDEKYYTSAGDNFGLSGFRLKPHPRVIGGTVSYKF